MTDDVLAQERVRAQKKRAQQWLDVRARRLLQEAGWGADRRTLMRIATEDDLIPKKFRAKAVRRALELRQDPSVRGRRLTIEEYEMSKTKKAAPREAAAGIEIGTIKDLPARAVHGLRARGFRTLEQVREYAGDNPDRLHETRGVGGKAVEVLEAAMRGEAESVPTAPAPEAEPVAPEPEAVSPELDAVTPEPEQAVDVVEEAESPTPANAPAAADDDTPLDYPADVVRDALSLVLIPSAVPSIEAIEAWTDEVRRHVVAWAGAVHLMATDPDQEVEYVPYPEVLRAYADELNAGAPEIASEEAAKPSALEAAAMKGMAAKAEPAEPEPESAPAVRLPVTGTIGGEIAGELVEAAVPALRLELLPDGRARVVLDYTGPLTVSAELVERAGFVLSQAAYRIGKEAA